MAPTLRNLEPIVSLAKRRGFVYPSAEIYGGTGAIWDYGPLGAEMKRNIKNAWWSRFVHSEPSVVPLDSAIITRREVLQASGHESGFTDPLVECKDCHTRFRYDHLLEGQYGEVKKNKADQTQCPNCGGVLTEPKQFNLMFKTFIGPVEDEGSLAYLRPETAQGIFTNFRNVVDTTRQKLPFGIAQIGKAFRNEVTPGNFIFRTREFEQCEIEWFIEPDNILSKKTNSIEGHLRSASEWYDYFIQESMTWFQNHGVKKENLRLREHDKDELAHYAIAATDIEYNYPFGWSELQGIARRGDYDLKQHQKHSKKDLTYFDEVINERYLPEVVEPSMGVERAFLTFLIDAYEEIPEDEKDGRKKGEKVLRLHPSIAPIKVAVLPLVKKDQLPEIAGDIYKVLLKRWAVQYDAAGSIGRRYRRQDEIGTPFCVTVDFESLDDKAVTVRDRDTLKQERVEINKLEEFFIKKLVP